MTALPTTPAVRDWTAWGAHLAALATTVAAHAAASRPHIASIAMTALADLVAEARRDVAEILDAPPTPDRWTDVEIGEYLACRGHDMTRLDWHGLVATDLAPAPLATDRGVSTWSSLAVRQWAATWETGRAPATAAHPID